MLIRPAIQDDLPAIAALHIANWRRDYAGLLPEEALGAPLAAEKTARWSALAPSEELLLVCMSEASALTGFACVLLHHPKGPLLDNLHVAQQARWQGIGARLMGQCARQLGDLGYASLWLEVLEGNTPTRAIYRRLGGVEGAVEIDHLLGHPVRSIPVRWSDLSQLEARA